jgi:hypothetical protein
MKLREALTECRRRAGFLFPASTGDIEWFVRKNIRENPEVYEALARA